MADGETTHAIISRKDAKALGLKYYFTGIQCDHGDLSQRFAASGMCLGCSASKLKAWRQRNLEREREKRRKWTKGNPDKIRVQNKKSYARIMADPVLAAKERERKRGRIQMWRDANPEMAVAKDRAFKQRHKDRLRARRLELAHGRPRRPATERQKEYLRKWRDRNRHKKKAYHRNRKARKSGNGGTHTGRDILAIFTLQKGKCACCGTRLGAHHVDHIIPLARGGGNDRKNLQVLCVPCNKSKHARDPIEFMRAQGRLL